MDEDNDATTALDTYERENGWQNLDPSAYAAFIAGWEARKEFEGRETRL